MLAPLVAHERVTLLDIALELEVAMVGALTVEPDTLPTEKSKGTEPAHAAMTRQTQTQERKTLKRILLMHIVTPLCIINIYT